MMIPRPLQTTTIPRNLLTGIRIPPPSSLLSTNFMQLYTIKISKPGWVIGTAAMLVSVLVGIMLAQNYVAHADAGHSHDEASAVAGTASKYPVVTVFNPIKAQELENGVEASGEVLPGGKADIYPMRDGKVKQLLVDVGSTVKTGQVIGYLYPDLEQNRLAAEVKVKKAELERLKQELPLLDKEEGPLKEKLQSGASYADTAIKLTGDIKNQLAAEYDVKIQVAEAAMASAEKETGSTISKIDVQKDQLLKEIETKLQVNTNAIASLSKEEEANLKKLDAQISGQQQQTGQKSNSLGITSVSAMNDLIDIFGDMVYTDPGIIRSANRFNSSFLKLNLYQLKNNDFNAFHIEMSQFVSSVLANANGTDVKVIKELNSKALDLGKRARDLVSAALMTPEEIASFRSRLDSALEHLNTSASELAAGDITLTTSATELEAEKQRVKAEYEQKIASLEGENTVLNTNKSQVQNLEADQKVLTVTKEQRIRELQGEIANLKTEKARVLADQSAAYNERQSTLNTFQKDLSTLLADTEIKITKTQLDSTVKSAEIASIEGQIGAGEAITAPFDGVITKRYLNKGDSTSLDKPVFALINEDQKFIRFFVSEADRPFATQNKVVTFAPTSAPLEKHTAKIIRVSQEIDKETRTILVEAAIEGDTASLLSQMTVRVSVPVSDDSSMVAVPEQALQQTEDKDTVWIITADVKADKRSVKVAHVKNGYAFISSGLSTNDWVIVKSPVDLKPQLEVDTKQ